MEGFYLEYLALFGGLPALIGKLLSIGGIEKKRNDIY